MSHLSLTSYGFDLNQKTEMVQQYWNNAEATIHAYKDMHALTIAIGVHIGIENTYDKQIHLLEIELHHNHEFLREFFCCCKYVTIAFWRCPACKQMNEVERKNRQNCVDYYDIWLRYDLCIDKYLTGRGVYFRTFWT